MHQFKDAITEVDRRVRSSLSGQRPDRTVARADTTDGSKYVPWDPKVVTAVQVALATGRPLLVTGRPGSGKSLLARRIALDLDRNCLTQVVTSRTQAQDLLWRVDNVRRLRDATAPNGSFDDSLIRYVQPGILWWALQPHTARLRGGASGAEHNDPPTPPEGFREKYERSVLLIDEIDKADPDMPNSLLIPLGQMSFEVTDLGIRVEAAAERWPFVIITSNGERDLSPAFERRCVKVELSLPSNEDLREIGRAHFNGDSSIEPLMDELLGRLQPDDTAANRAIVPASFVDVLRAVKVAEITPGSVRWGELLALLDLKDRSTP